MHRIIFLSTFNYFIIVDEYHGESYLDYNQSTHCHIENENIIEELTYLANAILFSTEKKTWFDKDFQILKIVEKDDYDTKIVRFLKNKHLKVYSALELIDNTN